MESVGKDRNTVGRTYLNEMDKLAQTLEWANNTSIGELADAFNKIGSYPIFAVGSGGSLAGAAYWSMVNELMTGQPSKYGTPLELLALPLVSPYAVGLMSAGGGNPDIVQSLAHAARDGSPGQFILTFAKASQLNEEAERHGTAHVISFAPPIPKDGYLATNSLLASMVLVLRGYCAASEIEQLLLSDLPAPRQVDVNPDISTYSLLYAGWGSVAAGGLRVKAGGGRCGQYPSNRSEKLCPRSIQLAGETWKNNSAGCPNHAGMGATARQNFGASFAFS